MNKKSQKIIISLFVVGAFIFGYVTMNVKADGLLTAFGAKTGEMTDTYAGETCSCPGYEDNTLITYDTSSATGLGVYGSLVYSDILGSTLYSNYEIDTPSIWHLGLYDPLGATYDCYQDGGDDCSVVNNDGLIYEVGTGSL